MMKCMECTSSIQVFCKAFYLDVLWISLVLISLPEFKNSSACRVTNLCYRKDSVFNSNIPDLVSAKVRHLFLPHPHAIPRTLIFHSH